MKLIIKICKYCSKEITSLYEKQAQYNIDAHELTCKGESKTENCQGGLWLTTMGRVVLDDHGYEVFSEPGDRKLFTAEELSKGVGVKEFQSQLIDALQKEVEVKE